MTILIISVIEIIMLRIELRRSSAPRFAKFPHMLVWALRLSNSKKHNENECSQGIRDSFTVARTQTSG